MVRQSISVTTPNDDWLNSLIECEEYSSKSEIINDLIRKARNKQEQIENIRAKLIEGENSGFIEIKNAKDAAKLKAEIREEALEELRQNGKL